MHLLAAARRHLPICHTTFASAVNPYYDWHYDLALLICF